MRLLHVYSGNLFGGIETMLVACARAASACPGLHHEFAVCFDDQLAAALRHAGCAVHQLGPVRMRRPGTVRAARRALEDLLAAGPFDRVVCHAPWTQAIFGSVVRRRRVPLVFWAHDVMTGGHWTERLARLVLPDLGVCNSAFTASTLHHLYPQVRSVVVHPPVLAVTGAGQGDAHGSPAAPDMDGRQTLRASLETSPSAFVIAQASRCEPWKGHSALLDALVSLSDEPDWVWWVIGGAQRPEEDAYMATLRQTAADRGVSDRIRWVGQRSDVLSLLKAADLHCQANQSPEPFGIAFVEALAAGLPVVTVGFGGATEIVDASCGVLIPPDDPPALGAALRRLMRDTSLRERLSHHAPIRARHLCDPATQLRVLSDALASMIPLEATG